MNGIHGTLLFPLSTLSREHGPDCGPCLLTRSLHSPDTRSHSTKLKRFCPSCSKGQLGFFGYNAFFIIAVFSSFFSPFMMCNMRILVCADSLFGLLCLWRNGRQRGVAAGWPTHPASDSRTQSQFQLARNAYARLKIWLPCILLKTWTAEYLLLSHSAMSDQKNWWNWRNALLLLAT